MTGRILRNPGTVRVGKACSCGATMQATFVGGDDVGEALQWAWATIHAGPDHLPVIPAEAMKARKRRLEAIGKDAG